MTAVNAEVMAIGDELTSGQRLDTNSQWLSQQLGDLGVRVLFHTTVGDDQAALVQAFRNAAERANIVIVTGGLGPTADDITRQAMADAANVPLELRPEVLEHIRARFLHRGRAMPPQNELQAMFPRGSYVIPNPHGTAPGIDFSVGQGPQLSRIFALPGVPAEMQEMWQETVLPTLREMLGISRVIYHHSIKCFGAGESELEGMLPDLIHRDRIPRVGITVHRATITLRVTSEGPDEASCREAIEPTLQTIRNCLGSLVFGEGDEELEHAVLRLLSQHQATLSLCEWGTAGVLGRWLHAADVDGRVRATLVSRGLEGVKDALGDPGESLDEEQLVGWAAQAMRERFHSDYGLAVSPLPAADHVDPKIYVGLAGPKRQRVVAFGYRGHPDVVLERAAKQALDLLRHELVEASGPNPS